ncbi:MAG: pseudouridine synthase [Kofleriaceae bacterium]
MGARLRVGNLGPNASEAGLRALVAAGGREVVAIALVTDRETGRGRGFAFVELASAAAAAAAADALDGVDLDGRRLRVSLARSRSAPGPAAEATMVADGERGSRPGSVARVVRFTVPPEDDGVRLDQALARGVDDLSRRRARVVIDLGGVFVDRAHQGGEPPGAGRPGDRGPPRRRAGPRHRRARRRGPGAGRRRAAAADGAVRGRRPHRRRQAGRAGDGADPESDRGNLADLQGRRVSGPIFVVHRLDRPTSGVLVLARTDLANRELGRAFAAHDLEREYRAVVAGAYAGPSTIDRPIAGKRAVTHVEPVAVYAGATQLRCTLETGRTHQIRLHLAGLGHPVLGDTQHGGERSRTFSPRPPRLALHARVLAFAHPRTGAAMRFEREFPEELAGWIALLPPEAR